MAKFKGEDARVYIGTRDASGDLMSIEPKFSRTLHEITVLNSPAKVFSPGQAEASYNFEAFYDTASGIVAQLWDTIFINSTGGRAVTSIFLGNPLAIGSKGICFPDGYLKQNGQPEKVNEMVMINGEMQPSGQSAMLAVVLHLMGAEGTTGGSTVYDALVSSSAGGRGNIHVTGVTGSNPHTIKIQHSVDNSTWVDLIAFSSVAGATSQSLECAGTVQRYRKVTFTVGSTSTVTFLVGFGSY